MSARQPRAGTAAPGWVAATAVMAVVVEAPVFWHFGWSPPLGAYLVFGATATVVSATDIASRRVPNWVVLAAVVVGAVLFALASGIDAAWWSLARAGVAMAVLAGFYLALGLMFPSGMGMDDVKWAAVIGLYLGWLGWSAVATGTLLAFAAAAVAVLALRPATFRRGRLVVPMAPFISAGALVAVLVAR